MNSPMFLLIAAMLAAPLTTLAADSHDHGSAKQHKVELNAGKKWATDAPLRQAMTALRTSTTAILPSAHAGKASAENYDAYGKVVAGQVTYIVQNCKLDPKADAQLHLVIGDIMTGAAIAEGKQPDQQRASGVVKVAQALNAYGKHFDHGGWQAIRLPH